jgi:hydrogenase expression/formation protein HypC
MCVAVAARIIRIEDGNKASAEYHGNIIEVKTGISNPVVGDYCLIHAGCVIEIINKKRAGEIDEIMDLLEEAYNEQTR